MRGHAATTAGFNHPIHPRRRCLSDSVEPPFSRKISFHHHLSPPPLPLLFTSSQGLEYKHGETSSYSATHAINRGESAYKSSWDDKPYQYLPNGKRIYLDEQDIMTFLDPPKDLIPLEPSSYNPASYIWKKIEDIPEERRHRLLNLLDPRLISRAWQIAGTRYEDPKLAKRSEYNLLENEEEGAISLEFYNCRASEGPMPIAWINFFRKAIFYCDDGNIYGRFIGGSFLEGIASNMSPLYFLVKNLKEVMSTEQPCDFAYEFGDGLFDVPEYPHGFPKPGKHPYPFNDQVVVYVRHLGPGVLVAQAWQEGKALEQVPQKLCTEILMVKEYASI